MVFWKISVPWSQTYRASYEPLRISGNDYVARSTQVPCALPITSWKARNSAHKRQHEGHSNGLYSAFARSPLSLPQSLFSRSLRSTICNLGHPHPMRTLRITNGGHERAKKTEFGGERGRSWKHRIKLPETLNSFGILYLLSEQTKRLPIIPKNIKACCFF